MTYQQQQKSLMDHIERQFQTGETPATIVEPVADYANDSRTYLTSVTHLSPDLQQAISTQLIQPLKTAFPKEYFIPLEALHLTILSVRLFKDNTFFDTETLERIKTVFTKVIPLHPPITFELKGLLKLPTSFGIRCYCAAELGELIQHLQSELKQIGILTDKKLVSKTVFFSNITICRFTKIIPSAELAAKTKAFENIDLGKVIASKIYLVKTNAVASPKTSKIIGKYQLLKLSQN